MKPIDSRVRRAVLALGATGLATTTAVAGAQEAHPTTAPAPAPAKAEQAAPKKRATSRVTIAKRTLDVRVGSTATVRGRVHAHAPRLVRLQRRIGEAWETIAKDRPDGQGRFTLKARRDEAGSARVRVRYSGDEHTLASLKEAGRLNVFRTVQASWYGPGFYGSRTACGQTFSAGIMGVAHKTLPCGKRLSLRKGDRVVRVTVVDRGPYAGGRELDLSPAVKSALGFGSTGAVGVSA